MKTILSFSRCLILASALVPLASSFAAAIFTPNSQPTGWVGEVDVSSFDFSSGTQVIFKGDFVKGEWSGNLSAFPVDEQGTVLFAAERWAAGDILDDQNYDSGRNIVTMKSDGTKIPFRWASLGTTQQAAIDNSKSATTVGPNIVNYLRGDRTNEKPNGTNLYRPRAHVLGDIIHSRPLFVDHATDPRVYVGANDGMLHSFDADSGRRGLRLRSVVLHLPGRDDELLAHQDAHRRSVRPQLLRRRVAQRCQGDDLRRRQDDPGGRRRRRRQGPVRARHHRSDRRLPKRPRRARSCGRSRRRRSTTPPARRTRTSATPTASR